jgi:hypothetical protein
MWIDSIKEYENNISPTQTQPQSVYDRYNAFIVEYHKGTEK